MNTQNLRLLTFDTNPALLRQRVQPLGQILIDNGIISSDQLVKALHMQLTLGAPIGEILVAEGWATNDDIQEALSYQHDIPCIDLLAHPPDERLSQFKPYTFWLKHGVVPWKDRNGTVLIATYRPDRFDELRVVLADTFTDTSPLLASKEQISRIIARQFTTLMAQAAGTRVAACFSCRTWQSNRQVALPLSLALFALAFLIAPSEAFAILSIVAIVTLMMFAILKGTAFVTFLFSGRRVPPRHDSLPSFRPVRRPKISMLVPLFREREIATVLVRRLAKLTYPKSLLDVVLVLEENDDITQQTLSQTKLPPWMRVIRVPAYGGLTTKPRAMNYALDFCHGDIIGIWDAEDAPNPDQLEKAADRFAAAPENVVCLQGVLDYYNPRTNWLSRCFTIEYASWFRVVLPGIARLGLVVPLGGTTLFFKRDKLEELGGWDAHNVTEDADLGVRLSRAGYHTEMLDTTTFEEANCRPWHWVKQRSRWLKGFMVTYLVHMRNPHGLLRDLGWARFLGFQAFFVGTLSQFLLAPVLWSFWLVLLGASHPLQDLVPAFAINIIVGLFVATECLVFCIGLTAVANRERGFLIPWLLTMPLYFPLATIASYKALYELVFKPYYWDKTQHGHASSELPEA